MQKYCVNIFLLFFVHFVYAQKTTVYCETFEALPVGWHGSEDWLAEDGWLKHNLQRVAGVSFFMHKADTSAFTFKQFEWSANIEMRDYTLSTNNYFRFYLLSDAPDATATGGVYFTVNGTGINNLSLVEFRSGKVTTLARGTAVWDRNTAYRLRVTYSKSDGLSVFLGEDKVLEVRYNFPQEFSGKNLFSGIMFNFTETRAGKLRVDDLIMTSSFTQACFYGFNVISDQGIKLCYTLPIAEPAFTASGNYVLRSGDDKIVRIDSIRLADPFSVILYTILETGDYMLDVKDMAAITGEVVITPSITFSYIASARFGDICINEIMFKPADGFGLPKEEYIEIYNRQDYAVRLDSIAYEYRGEIADYINDTLRAGEFLILCRLAGVDTLSAYGKTYRIKGFSLLDAGASIVLQTKAGVVIDSVTYRQEWVRDLQKRKGGYSLERIAPVNILPQVFNWYESQDSRGGTPGEMNSVYLSSPDLTPPKLVSYTIVNEYQAVLLFSEDLYEILASEKQHYRLEETDYLPDSIGVKNNEVNLRYNIAFERNRPYRLHITGIKDLSGNTMKDTVVELFLFAVAEPGDLLLSEVLYDAEPSTAEYIELFNNSNKRINLHDIRIGKINDSGKLTLLKRIADSDIVLEPDSLVWICSEPEEIMGRYHYHNPDNYLQISAMLQLSNSEGYVALLRQDSLILDELHFYKGLHDPRVTRTKGVALERTSYDLKSDLPEAWTSAGGDEADGYGSPGRKNRLRDEDKPDDTKEFRSFIGISPEVFTPDGDGYEDELQILVNVAEKPYTLRLFICNAAGQLIKRLVNGVPVSASTCYMWNGQAEDGRLLPSGIYVIYAELLFSSGKKEIERKVCVLSR